MSGSDPLRDLPDLILALDVSSTVTGYAVGTLDGLRTEWGVIVPRMPPASEVRAMTDAARSVDRIDQMVAGVHRLTNRFAGADLAVVLEWTAGKSHGSIHRKMSGLAILGHAQGAVRQSLKGPGMGYEPVLVGENEWTRRVPKAKRAEQVGQIYPQYAHDAAAGIDPGLDMADAIGLLDWYRAAERTRRLLAEHGGSGPGLESLAGKGLAIVLPEGLELPRSRSRRSAR